MSWLQLNFQNKISSFLLPVQREEPNIRAPLTGLFLLSRDQPLFCNQTVFEIITLAQLGCVAKHENKKEKKETKHTVEPPKLRGAKEVNLARRIFDPGQ